MIHYLEWIGVTKTCDHLFMLQNDECFSLSWSVDLRNVNLWPMTSLKAFTQEPSSRLAIQWQTSHGSLGKTPGRGRLCDKTLVVTPDPGICHYSTLSGHRACKELAAMKMFVCASSTNIHQTVLHEFASIHIHKLPHLPLHLIWFYHLFF